MKSVMKRNIDLKELRNEKPRLSGRRRHDCTQIIYLHYNVQTISFGPTYTYTKNIRNYYFSLKLEIFF